MVRLEAASEDAASLPRRVLHLAALDDEGKPLIRLRVETVEFWTLENVTVLHTPDSSLVGAPFQHINAAMGQLKRWVPAAAHDYLEVLHAYVVGPLDAGVLGNRVICFKLYGESVSTRHTPELLTAPVRCLEQPTAGGRWLPVSVLRPFAPALLSDEDANAKMRDLMRQVPCRHIRAPALDRCCAHRNRLLLAPRRISTFHSCGRNFDARPRGLRTLHLLRAASVSCRLASKRLAR